MIERKEEEKKEKKKKKREGKKEKEREKKEKNPIVVEAFVAQFLVEEGAFGPECESFL